VTDKMGHARACAGPWPWALGVNFASSHRMTHSYRTVLFIHKMGHQTYFLDGPFENRSRMPALFLVALFSHNLNTRYGTFLIRSSLHNSILSSTEVPNGEQY
jgi:hypothetical protein